MVDGQEGRSQESGRHTLVHSMSLTSDHVLGDDDDDDDDGGRTFLGARNNMCEWTDKRSHARERLGEEWDNMGLR
jgi:hypothetical protein